MNHLIKAEQNEESERKDKEFLYGILRFASRVTFCTGTLGAIASIGSLIERNYVMLSLYLVGTTMLMTASWLFQKQLSKLAAESLSD